ncbi:hypothetical protein SLS59_008679 [Nothophoma quercina]|uniref:Uncharacterized protein n=1 Tax=Nothophoma quercina TaxID=749835 RepID=A0ABR3QRT2_9PLEO
MTEPNVSVSTSGTSTNTLIEKKETYKKRLEAKQQEFGHYQKIVADLAAEYETIAQMHKMNENAWFSSTISYELGKCNYKLRDNTVSENPQLRHAETNIDERKLDEVRRELPKHLQALTHEIKQKEKQVEALHAADRTAYKSYKRTRAKLASRKYRSLQDKGAKEWYTLWIKCADELKALSARLEREEEQLVGLKKERAELVTIDRVNFEEDGRYDHESPEDLKAGITYLRAHIAIYDADTEQPNKRLPLFEKKILASAFKQPQ